MQFGNDFNVIKTNAADCRCALVLCSADVLSPHVQTPVCAFVLRHAARVHSAADAERMANGTPKDSHLCPRRSSEL